MRSTDLVRRGNTRRRARLRAHRPQGGLTLVEIVVAMSVLVVAATIFGQMLLSTSRLRQLNHENALAADAARVVLERMHNLAFHDVYRSFNEDPADDPLGKGTGPGYLFAVDGLTPIDGAPGGKAGRITFPSRQVQVTTETTTSGGGKKSLGGTTTTTTSLQWHVREDFQDKKLGMPRDLNGNNVVDTANHSTDYIVLPARIEIQWKNGPSTRHFELVTQLADFRLRVEP